MRDWALAHRVTALISERLDSGEMLTDLEPHLVALLEDIAPTYELIRDRESITSSRAHAPLSILLFEGASPFGLVVASSGGDERRLLARDGRIDRTGQFDESAVPSLVFRVVER